MNLKATNTNVIYTKRDQSSALKSGELYLSDYLDKDTMWVDCVVAGDESILKAGDELLLSRRPVSFTFEIDGVTMYNTSDASSMAFKRNGTLMCTGKTCLYTWLDGEQDKEEKTASGLFVVTKNATKEQEPRWAIVAAAGPETGVQAGDHVLIAYKTDCYKVLIDGVTYRNAGKEEIIAYTRPSNE